MFVELEAKLDELKKRRIEKPVAEQKTSAGQGNNKSNNSAQKDKENEMSEEEKAKQKSKPISSTAVAGTPWCVVWTRDKRVFFYNPSEKVSLWERPPILIGRADVDRMVKECPVTGATEASSSSSSNTTTTATGNNSASGKKKSVESNSEQPPVKKNKLEEEEGSQSPRSDGSASPRTPSKVAPDEFLQKKEIEASKEAAIEAENKAAQVRAQLPLEQRIQQFRDLLTEKDVSAYSTWEKELQKIVFDPRYLLLTSKERKAVFEKYVRERADQESKERSAALKKKKEEFRELLKEVISNPKMAPSFAEISSKYARDERFKGIDKTKDRESIYNDFLSDLRRQLDKQDEAKHDKRKNFYAMLKEIKHLHRHSSWSETKKLIENDSRYKCIESSSKREDYFRDYCKTLQDEKDTKVDSHLICHLCFVIILIKRLNESLSFVCLFVRIRRAVDRTASSRHRPGRRKETAIEIEIGNVKRIKTSLKNMVTARKKTHRIRRVRVTMEEIRMKSKMVNGWSKLKFL